MGGPSKGVGTTQTDLIKPERPNTFIENQMGDAAVQWSPKGKYGLHKTQKQKQHNMVSFETLQGLDFT